MPLHNLFRDGPSSTSTRRRFVGRSLGLMAAAPLAGCIGGGDDDRSVVFTHGVASGDPLADRVILWTRVRAADTADLGDVPVRWEVASDAAFTQLVASGDAVARAASDFTVKVDARGLAAGQRYHYRFATGGQLSPVGRCRTLPSGGVTQARLAVFSCANYPAGYFHAYAEAAKRDLDAVLHLGDYLYEYAPGGYASSQAERMGRVVQPAKEIVTLDDYRRRYAQYRSDPDLLALHAAHPMIAIWDDHEITNDAWRDGAENHQPATEGSYAARKAAALQAWHEWMPVRSGSAQDQIWRRFDWGNLMSLHMLDTRIAGRDEQLDYANFIGSTGFDAARFTSALSNPARQLLGSAQQAWVQQQLASSTATWQVLGQQVLMGRMNIPAPILFEANQPGTGVSVSAYAALLQKAQSNPASLTPQEQAVLAQPSIPYNLDAWDGYAVARETLLGTAAALNKNLVTLAGDTHNAWASDLRLLNGTPVGVEFATPSVSSPGFEEYLPRENPAFLAGSLAQLIDPLVWCDTARRGFLQLTVTPGACRAEFVFVSSVFERNYTASTGGSWQVLAGQKRIVAG